MQEFWERWLTLHNSFYLIANFTGNLRMNLLHVIIQGCLAWHFTAANCTAKLGTTFMFNYHVIFQSFWSSIFLITMATLKKSFLFCFWNFFCMATRNMGFQTHFTNINVRAMWANVFFPVFINWRKGPMSVPVMSN